MLVIPTFIIFAFIGLFMPYQHFFDRDRERSRSKYFLNTGFAGECADFSGEVIEVVEAAVVAVGGNT